MKRIGNLYSLIADPDNIRLAFQKAVKGKQERSEVIEFKKDLANNIRKLYFQLKDHCLDIGKYRFFHVYDPKCRFICAAPFQERVLHHAVMNICELILDNYAIYDSYACRKNKGVHKALARSQEYSRKYDWYLKLDIKKYFDSIDHKIVMQLLSRRIKDKDVCSFFNKILKTYNTSSGKGLPIGNLISQHLANFYLGVFDHWIKEERKVKGYLRYMDDFLLFATEKERLKIELEQIKIFLADKLKLSLKGNIQLNRSVFGIPFLGYRVRPDRIMLTSQSKKRFIRKFRMYESNWVQGKWSIAELTRHMEPLIEFTKYANADDFRGKIIKQFGVLS